MGATRIRHVMPLVRGVRSPRRAPVARPEGRVAALAGHGWDRGPAQAGLVGDSIHRITLESTRGLRPPEALAEALCLGREFIDDQAQIFHEFRERTDFTFINCGEVQTWDSYQGYHRMLRDHFSQDARCHASLEAFGRGYHRKNSGGVPEAELERRIQRSLDYFLEEFAIFCCLKDKGLPVMLYPGSFGTLSEIAAGEHEGAPKPLRDLIVVSLQLRGR
ncbi:tRNA-dependent cyclodipeptide synthase [Streptomyces platensis]|uniref:tRNA-dependent cyclodipeptide synthase n=1 Tax=Streptomyces platensis TaxID=58346 RepID=UPI001F37F9D3|nr:tRNA-dependent cyclodipeptide synthase [Streptomyces platensis]MCF3144010.1 tRNA-dependent cyclodipeptide synthase [Streptomyces platensis]